MKVQDRDGDKWISGEDGRFRIEGRESHRSGFDLSYIQRNYGPVTVIEPDPEAPEPEPEDRVTVVTQFGTSVEIAADKWYVGEDESLSVTSSALNNEEIATFARGSWVYVLDHRAKPAA